MDYISLNYFATVYLQIYSIFYAHETEINETDTRTLVPYKQEHIKISHNIKGTH